ncbi:MAG: restriction endonuclease subunit S [Proteobacteria bacterium]|nr:restriction endonuclease subunit S [Pseudomonadota bacterium]
MPGRYQSYPEYKDSGVEWLGNVPLVWKVLPLKFVSENRVKDGPHETPKFIDEGVPFFSVDSIQDHQLIFEGCRYISPDDHKRFSLKCLPKKGDVLLGKAASVGKVAYVDTEREFNVWSPLAVITPQNGNLGKFIFYSFQSAGLQAQCDIFSNSNTQKNLSMQVIDNLTFALPSIGEANHIANFLDHETAKIDTLIEKQQQLIKLLKEKRQAVISHAVTKGLNPEAPTRNSGVEWLGDVPEHWRIVRRIKFISSLKGRLGWQGLKADEYIDEGPYVLSSAHFSNYIIQWDACPHVSLERYKLDSNIQLAEGDILLMKDGAALGKLAYVDNLPGKACLNSHLLLFRPVKKNGEMSYIPKFMFYFMQTDLFQDYVKVNGTGATFLGISQQAVGNYRLAFPPQTEQQEIVDYLEMETFKLDSLEEKQRQMMNLLQERRTALISAAVTGKIDVRNWQAPAQNQINKEEAA